MLVGELEVDDVEAGLGGPVGDVEAAVLVVLAFDLCLARPLYGEGEAAVARVPRVHVEGVVRVGLALLEGVARDLDLAGVANVARADVDLEGGVGDVLAAPLDGDEVLADLLGREGDAGVALGQLLQVAGLLGPARRDDVGGQRAEVVV